MSRPSITLRGGDYPLARFVAGAQGAFDLHYDACGAEAAFNHILEGKPIQASEFSLANFGMMRDRGADHLVAIPVFFNRAFRHGVAWTREDSPLEDLRDLVGKRVGMKEYSQTAAVWFRGLLQDEYGVDWRDIHWFVPRRQRFPAPAEAGVGTLDGNLEQRVLDGELDAYVSTRATLPGLRPVLRNHAEASAEYLARTGIFPINHTVVLDRALLAEHPTLASVVFDAYCAARGKAGDLHRFGFAGNDRMIVETVFRYLHEQRLTERLQRVDDLFILRDAVDGA